MTSTAWRVWRASFVATAGLLASGCETEPKPTTGPAVFALSTENYAQVFDAAVELAAEEGMLPTLRDRDGGVIETRPKVSGSLIEPWNWAGGSGAAAVDATLAFQRRRIRFEFVPSGFRPIIGEPDDPLTGQRAPGAAASDASGVVDFASYEGPIELRVWVYVERAFTPNLQRSPWTFTERSIAVDPLANRPTGDATTRDRSIWTPTDRDEVMEQAVLGQLRARLERGLES